MKFEINSNGLTFVEALMALGISVVIGGLLVAILVNSAGLFYKESSKLQGGLNINESLSKIREGIKEANSVATSYVDGSTTYTSSQTQLVLKVPSQDSSGNIIQNTYDHHIYLKDENYLRFKIFPDATSVVKMQDQILTTTLDSIKFQYFDLANPPQEAVPSTASKVRVNLTLKKRVGLNFETNTATSEAFLRND